MMQMMQKTYAFGWEFHIIFLILPLNLIEMWLCPLRWNMKTEEHPIRVLPATGI